MNGNFYLWKSKWFIVITTHLITLDSYRNKNKTALKSNKKKNTIYNFRGSFYLN